MQQNFARRERRKESVKNIQKKSNKISKTRIYDYIRIASQYIQNIESGILYIKLRHPFMDEELRTRDSQRSYTAQQRDQMNWSESSQTYYFSKFQLFQDTEEINQFYRYSVFLQQVSEELGQQWKSQANVLFSPHFNNQDIFMNLLNIWLQLHPVVNTVHQNPLTKQSSPVFNNNFIEEFIARMKALYSENTMEDTEKLELKINYTSTKTICMGFFITANQIWNQMFRTEDKNINKGFSLLKGVTKKIEQSFEPLMVVTQKISNLFGRKKVKVDQSIHNSIKNDGMFQDCYMEFRRTIGLQKQLQRKMSQFCLDQQPDQRGVKSKDKKKVITKDEFKQSDAPMQTNVIESIYSYITKFLKRKYPWQVASSFVTNILDINEQTMQDGTKIKILKPAEDFYEKLVIGWLMLRKCKNEKAEITFEAYLQHIKIAFGRAWREKYIIPTKYFYERLMKHWNDIKRDTSVLKISQKQILSCLINKIRESMREDWQRKIKIQKKNSKQKY